MVFFQCKRQHGVIFLSILLTFIGHGQAVARHDVVKGDTLSGVSQQRLGRAQHWSLLHKRNAAHVKNPHRIYPSQSLRLQGPWYGNVLVGAGFAVTGKNQNLVVKSNVENGYSANREGSQSYFIGAGGGYRFILAPAWDLALGIEADYINYGRSSGVVHPLINFAPNHDILSYHYDAKSYAVMGNARLRWWHGRHGFIETSAAVGLAWNTLSNYTEIAPAGSTASPTISPFQDKTTRQPAFSLGIALGYQLNPRVALEMGYRYMNTGNAKLKVPAISDTQPTFTSGRLSAHMLYIDLLFD